MENRYESPIFETDGIYDDSVFKITTKDIEEISLPLERLSYTGEGVTSFSSKYDEQKMEYLKSFGIELENLDHAQKVTSFIIFSHLASLKEAAEKGLDLDKAVEIVNNILSESRIDTLGFREDLGNGVTYEQIRKGQGYSANSECKVSIEEYNILKQSIIKSLTIE